MTKQQIFDLVRVHACQVIPDLKSHHFEPSDSLRELGANSIDRSEIIMMTLEALSLSTPLVALASARNIGELVSIIYEKSNC
jgi:polyketide biosynthesis acyl carrier protein